MSYLYGVPQISPQDLAQKLHSTDPLIILDVREPWELAHAALKDPRLHLTPLSLLSAQGLGALPEPAQDQQAPLVVVCHHGVRSAEVTARLISQGWQDVHSLAGGLAAYAAVVDPSIGAY